MCGWQLFFWGGKKVRPHLFSVMPSYYWFIFPVNRNDLELPLKKIEKEISFDLDFFELNIKLIYHWNSFRSSLWVLPSLSPPTTLSTSTPLTSQGIPLSNCVLQSGKIKYSRCAMHIFLYISFCSYCCLVWYVLKHSNL